MRRLLITKLERLEAKLKPIPALRDPAVENARSDLVCDQIRESLLSFGCVQEAREPCRNVRALPRSQWS